MSHPHDHKIIDGILVALATKGIVKLFDVMIKIATESPSNPENPSAAS